ncbi:MAG: adenosylcobinamide-GDP ribazoletransferase [Bacteroidaceae bacterium]|nr:adenosylcobinamide-GDP ribazoletransferase [Bacteroidaceae bacterium]
MKHLAYRILAAFIFFTRLPFWRIAEVPKECYQKVVSLWPLVGWLTGGVMALTFWLTSFILPPGIAILLALTARLLITGALHEDGFADFCDGFGGGTTRQRVLDIMKDSHIGTYGVLGLIMYFLLLFVTFDTILGFGPFSDGAYRIVLLFLMADPFCKWVSSTIIYFLPYARTEAEAKNKLIYTRASLLEKILSLMLGILPMVIIVMVLQLFNDIPLLILACTTSILTAILLFHLMHRRIQGYTGDCCGATFIICELVFDLTALAYIHTYNIVTWQHLFSK